MSDLIQELVFSFQRLNWLSLVDLLLVTAIFFFLLRLLRGTQGAVLLRGMVLLLLVILLLTSLLPLPAFSYLFRNTLPAMLIAVPVVFAPEIRRALFSCTAIRSTAWTWSPYPSVSRFGI